MSKILTPIAVSSQLDVTGEERIHAAGYTQLARAGFVLPPPPIYIGYTQNDNSISSYRLGYATYNTETHAVTNVAWKHYYNGAGNYGAGIDKSPLILGNRLIGMVENDYTSSTPGTSVSGIKALKYDGTQTLVEMHNWQIDNKPYNLYHSIMKWDEDTIFAVVVRNNPSALLLKALNYDPVTGFTEVASFDLMTPLGNYSPKLSRHNDYIIVTSLSSGGNHDHAIFTYTPGVLTLLNVGPISSAGGSPGFVTSNGAFYNTQSGIFHTYDGSSISAETSYGQRTDGSMYAVESGLAEDVYFRPVGAVLHAMKIITGALTTAATYTFTLPMYGYISEYWSVKGNRLLIPSWSNDTGGVFVFDDTTLIKEAPLVIPDSLTSYYTVPALLPHGLTVE